MFDLQQSATEAGRNGEAKMWEVLISQIWNGLVGYCHAPKDLPQVRATLIISTLLELFFRRLTQDFRNYYPKFYTTNRLYDPPF